MTFKGSVVVKRTHLLNMISNMKTMFRSDVSDNSKWHIWGQQIGYERMLANDISDYDWDKFHTAIWKMPWTSGIKPWEMFNWLEEVRGSASLSKGDD